jgi:hypothetical protein
MIEWCIKPAKARILSDKTASHLAVHLSQVKVKVTIKAKANAKAKAKVTVKVNVKVKVKGKVTLQSWGQHLGVTASLSHISDVSHLVVHLSQPGSGGACGLQYGLRYGSTAHVQLKSLHPLLIAALTCWPLCEPPLISALSNLHGGNLRFITALSDLHYFL